MNKLLVFWYCDSLADCRETDIPDRSSHQTPDDTS